MKPSEAIEKLLAAGMTEAAIGLAVDCRQSTVNRIKRGDMIPNWETGKALIDLAEGLHEEALDPSRRFKAANEGDAAAETDGTSAPLKDAA